METFIMKMYFTETIRDLRHYLDLKRFEIRLSVFKISTTAVSKCRELAVEHFNISHTLDVGNFKMLLSFD